MAEPLLQLQPPVEAADIHPGKIVLTGVVIAATVALVIAVVHALLVAWHVEPGPDALPPMSIDGPVLPSAPLIDRARYDGEKRQLLHGYGWVDRKAGVARIPVQEAMRMLADADAKRRKPARREARP